MFIGFTTKVRGSGGCQFVDWTHQPWGRGPNAQPVAEDSAMVTVQIVPRELEQPVPAQGVSLLEAYATVKWSAAWNALMIAEVDIQQGVSFSITATHLTVDVRYKYSGATDRTVEINATVGRGTRPSFLDHPTRSFYLGVVAPNVLSTPVRIPYFARTLTVETANSPPNFSARVTQLSNGIVVQVDNIAAPQMPVTVNARADSVVVENVGANPQTFYGVFRIAL